jgi:hypothetical protein
MTAGACLAVGSTRSSGGTYTALSERWSGSSWSLVGSPGIPGAISAGLSSISCTASALCIGVGSYSRGSSSNLALAELWTGSAWTLQSARNAAGAASNFLQGVACPSSTACEAVGYFQTSTAAAVTVAERYS